MRFDNDEFPLLYGVQKLNILLGMKHDFVATKQVNNYFSMRREFEKIILVEKHHI
jgi:hypothetical protein